MKLLIVTALILGSTYANACCCQNDCEPKKPKIKYITKTKVVEKVVEKIVEKPVPFIVEKEVIYKELVPVEVTKTIYKKIQKKNRISVLGGSGPTHLSLVPTEARLERGTVFGVQYQRMLGNTLSIGIQGQSNQTVLGSIGLDF